MTYWPRAIIELYVTLNMAHNLRSAYPLSQEERAFLEPAPTVGLSLSSLRIGIDASLDYEAQAQSNAKHRRQRRELMYEIARKLADRAADALDRVDPDEGGYYPKREVDNG